MAVTDAPPEAAHPLPEPDAADGGDRSIGGRLPSWLTAERAVTALTLLGCIAFTFWQLQPRLLLADTTPAGGDMGAHVWAPAFLRDHLLPSGRLTGWTPDWYAGFPAFQFYMVLPSLAIVVLDLVLPYGIAFKLISVSGVLALPVAAYAFGRLARIPFPGPPLLAVGAVGFLFDRSFTIYGGNIASTLAGEFAFSISLAFAVLFLGYVLRGLESGRHRGTAAVLLGLTALCHLIPAIFAVVGAAIAWVFATVERRGVGGARRLWWLVSAGLVGSALTAWWTLPFLLRRSYLNDMGWEKYHQFAERLFPGSIGRFITELAGNAGQADGAIPGDVTWVAVFALVGVITSIAMGRRAGIYLGVIALVAAVGYVVAPQGRLWNARLLPFWFLAMYFLAALAVAEVAKALAVLFAKDVQRPLRSPVAAAPLVCLLGTVVFLGLSLRSLPFGSDRVRADGVTEYSFLGLSTTDRSFLPDWAKWNYSGYERKAAYPEHREIISTMEEVGADRGCGRAMWEYAPELDRFGTPMALMLLPHWTDGCIGSMEGLYFEASATTPYHFLNQSELSAAPSRAQRDLQYGPLDVDLGVQHLQLLGVRYYLAFSEQAVEQAAAEEDLTEVARIPEIGDAGVEWVVYEVADSELVVPVEAEPAVVEDVEGHETWLEMAEPWYLDPSRWDVLLAAGGPESWQRIEPDDVPRAVDVDAIEVSDIEEGTSTISFDVSDVGTPVLVKASYFPNWEVSGAEGPYRVAPNLMVVVPTDTHVELRYGRTAVDWLSYIVTLAGIVGAVVLYRRRMPAFPEPQPSPAPAPDPEAVPTEA
jgi:hypothetical protein